MENNEMNKDFERLPEDKKASVTPEMPAAGADAADDSATVTEPAVPEPGTAPEQAEPAVRTEKENHPEAPAPFPAASRRPAARNATETARFLRFSPQYSACVF